MNNALLRFGGALFVFVVTLLACTPTTHVTAVWQDPNVGGVTIDRALIVFQHESELERRVVEDALAEQIPNAVPSYEVIGSEEVFDTEGVRRKVHQLGFDTVIVTRLVDVDVEVDVVLGPPAFGPFGPYGPYGFGDYGAYGPYGPLWNTWRPGWSRVYSPAYLDRTTVVTLETLLYEVGAQQGGDDQLVWASRSETFDPRTIGALAESVVQASVRAMEEEGFLVRVRAREAP